MSFITKRERVFNEYDLFDLPARNEGKLKAYSSCTDARAWSHFCSDKTEHLVDIIKRNNETVRPKYVPTEIIVNTLMISKNAEIARLKRKIEEFEQMLAAYDQLELTCDQKCDIANAHAVIKAANKELDDMCLDLDLSGYTEGIDSEAFETGKSRGDELRYSDEISIEKSRGDEWLVRKESTPRMETKSNQFGESCTCDASTSAYDTRIDDLQGTIITKDAKLSAMQNTIAVMENDVCEPYCVYAHIYTALEKIFGTLCQNEKYKEYLDLLTAGKDTRGIDIKGKILFKIKVLEKFSLALIAPCSQEYSTTNDCSCYHAEILTQVQTTFALTSSEINNPQLDNKRAQLIADIMQNDDIKEIMSKGSLSTKLGDDQIDEFYNLDNYNIDDENLKRLKNLQSDYDDLLNCYDNLKHERDCLNIRCQKYVQLEHECECLQNKLREYKQLWKEKEYYRNRSEDLDALKENYLVLADETSNVETKLRAEQEISKVKSRTVDELKNENIKLDNKLTEVSLVYEKQKNMLVCKLKEYECKIMCQEQQIKSLSIQIDGFLEKDSNKTQIKDESQTLVLFDEIESQREQIKNLKDALCCNEEEKQYYQEEFENQLKVINQLKLAVEDWKSKYEKALQSNNCLEKYLEDYHVQMNNYQENNRLLNTEIEKKASAINNLNEIIDNKSQEVDHLINEVGREKKENEYLVNQIKSIHDDFNKNLQFYENEREAALASIHSAREESMEVLESIKNYTEKRNETTEQNITNKGNQIQINEMKRIESLIQENKTMDGSNIIKEFELLREINNENINILRCENEEIKKSFELAQKQSEILNNKILNQDNLIEKLQQFTKSHETLMLERDSLQDVLNNRTNDVNKLLQDHELTDKKSKELLDHITEYKCKYLKLNEAYKEIESERNDLQKKVKDAEALSKQLNRSETVIANLNDTIFLKTKEIEYLKRSLSELSKKFDSLQEHNQVLQKNLDEKCIELKKLGDILEKNIEENRILSYNYNILKNHANTADKNIEELKKEKSSMQVNLDIINKQSSERLDKLQHFKNIEHQYNDLMMAYHTIESEKKILQNNLHTQLEEFKKLQQENNDLNSQNKNLISLNEELERSLIRIREKATSHNDEHISLTNVKLEVNKLKAEKATCNNKISQLQDKLDESEFYINNLNEDILARDKKITTLENHINSLEDEIRKLQFNLEEVVQSGEEIKNLSFEKIDQSRNLLEAHYSKARHNLKMDLVKLQNEKSKLEEQLSKSELISRESCTEKQNFINKLQEEREQIISQIKQLEQDIFKESKLNPVKCTLIEVIHTLARIGKFLDLKNTSLEKTLLNVQDSYQILKSKAEEAKNIAEKERQKIIDEKEEMNKERKIIEEQLLELRNKLESDKVIYENVIQDLNGEISNQNLIFDKIKQIKENEILKLKEEKLSLKDLNAKLLVTQKDLEEKLYKQRNENKNIQTLIEKVSFDLKDKNMELMSLQKVIDDLKNKNTEELGIQVILDVKKEEVSTETYVTEKKLIDKSNNVYSYEIISELNDSSDSLNPNNGLQNLKISNLLHDIKNKESSIDVLKYIYINYKTKRLRIGRLEQYSITGFKIVPDNNVHELKSNSSDKRDIKSPSLKKSNINSMRRNDSIVNIYNTKILTDSTRNTYEIDNHMSSAKTESIKSSAIIELALTNDIVETDNEAKNNGGDESPISTDKDLFLIYEDSQTNSSHTQKPWLTNGYGNIIVERATVHTNQKHQLYEQNKLITTKVKEDKYYEANIDEPSEDDSIKPKLNVNLPRVLTDTLSTTTISDNEKISTDTYMRAIYATPRRKVFSDSNISINENYKNNQFDVASTIDNPNDYLDKSNNKFVNDANSPISVLPEVSLKSLNNIQETKKDTNTGKKFSKLTRTNAKTQILKYMEKKICDETGIDEDNDLNNTLNGNDLNINKNTDSVKFFSKSNSENELHISKDSSALKKSSSSCQLSTEYSPVSFSPQQINSTIDRAILVKLDILEDYEKEILQLTQVLENTEKDYKNKMEAIKVQYDSNIKRIINEHNQGVESIQSLHEEKLCDIIKIHDNEIENLRTMSIDALRKVEKLENENHYLKSKLVKYEFNFDEVPVKILTPDLKRKKGKSKGDDKTLTKTNVAVLDVKPKRRSHGPCTCSIDINVSDTIRNIFDQVDIEQRKMAEQTYLKYIANKILSENVEVLDTEELSFLHLKVCRTWKTRLNKEETLQKRIDSLECELINKQRQTHKHMAELDRKVAQEWKRLQEVREAVCCSHNSDHNLAKPIFNKSTTNIDHGNTVFEEKLSAGELEPERSCICRTKRIKASNRAVLAKLDTEGKKEKYQYNDETPIRLKRSHEHRAHKK